MKNMGDGRRVARVETEVQRLVAQYLITNLRGEIPGIITVARVKMPADLRQAKVYVSILGHEGKVSEAIKTLQTHAGEIQRFISDHLRTRYCPKLTFFEDDMTQKVLKVEEIIRSLEPSGSHLHAVPDEDSDDETDAESDENKK